MTDKDFHKLQEWGCVGGGLIPISSNAIELLEQTHKGEVLSFLEVTNRDIKFHRCYFSLLKFIHSYMPDKFKKAVPEKRFYKWLKHLKGEYEILFTFADGTVLVEYDSIAFGNMSQKAFENYVREQLPYIYQNVLGKYFEDEILNGIIDTIEEQFKKFMSKL
jgi:hypothetical protein